MNKMSLKDLPKFVILENGKKDEEALSCLICGRDDLENLAAHLSFKHGIKAKEYREKTGYKGPFMTTRLAKKAHQQQGKNKQLTREEKRKNFMEPDEFSLRMKLYERANSCCERCGVSEKDLLDANKRGLHLHHKNYDKTLPDLEDVELLCASCHSKIQPDISAKYNKVCKAVAKLLEALEVDTKDENFRETPRRMATYFMENFLSSFEIQQALEEYSSSTFPNVYGGMVVLKSTNVVGMCPHHLLPVFYKVSIGYIPTKTAIGLSKLHRIAEAIARTPLMQETYTVALTSYLQRILGTKDVAARVVGTHTCMTVRGVKVPNSEVITTDLKGSFMKESSTREEFYLLLNS